MKKFKGRIAPVVCIIQMFVLLGCAAKADGTVRQEQPASNETRQEQSSQKETRQEQPASNETRQEQLPASQVQSGTQAQNTEKTAPNAGGQISLDDAKTAALTDAGVTASDVRYTKEKLDYEDGIAVYELEFYAGNAEYEYEINAETGAVYSKDIDVHQVKTEHGHYGGSEQNDIGAEQAKSIALAQAGFAEAEVTLLQCEFDVDDGQTVYEVEFIKDGRQYEYKISASDGSILSYEMD